MHFTFDVSFGQVLLFVGFVGSAWRIDNVINRFMIEHEILIQDYLERKNLKDLPTRRRV